MRSWDLMAIGRSVVFGATAVALLSVAQSGQSQLWIQLCFTLFVVAATVWVRGQYFDRDTEDRQPVLPWPVSVGALGGVLAVLAFDLAGRLPAGVLLFALIGGYYVVGQLITYVRQRDGELMVVLGGLLTAAGAAAAVTGVLLLTADDSERAGILGANTLLGVSFLLLIPFGMALLSEHVVRLIKGTRRSAPWSARRAGLVAGIGLAVFVVMSALIVWATASWWLVAGFLVVGLLIVTLVSRTQADIAIVVGVIALAGVTPLPADPPRDDGPAAGGLLLSLGDSYMSGEGAQIYYEGTDEGGGNQCRRSPTAWAAMAGQQAPFGRLAFHACAGARTHDIAADQVRNGTTQRKTPQLDAYRTEHRGEVPALVVVGVGGNDAGFSAIGAMCLAPGNCDDKSKELWIPGLQHVRGAIDDTYRRLRAAFPGTPVAVVPYPDPVQVGGDCDDIALSPRERVFLHEFIVGDERGRGLNPMLKAAADAAGFHYIDTMQTALADAHLQLCDPENEGRPGLNFIGLRSVRGVAEQRFNPKNWWHSSLHPNERGHAAMLGAFKAWYARNAAVLHEPRSLTGAEQAATAAPAQAVHPPCSPLETSPAGCRAEGMNWAKDQVARVLLTWGWFAIAGLLGFWLTVVVLFGLAYRRRASAG